MIRRTFRCLVTLAGFPHFATFASGEGGTADCFRRVLPIGGAFLDPRLIFDPVMRGQMQIFAKSAIFQINMRTSQKLY